MRIPGLLILFIILACMHTAVAQDNTSFTDKLINLPARFNERIQKKTEKLEEQLTRQTEKYLQIDENRLYGRQTTL
jgi:cell division protein ZapA (FtsZ GTPase activity inhibitor)